MATAKAKLRKLQQLREEIEKLDPRKFESNNYETIESERKFN